MLSSDTASRGADDVKTIVRDALLLMTWAEQVESLTSGMQRVRVRQRLLFVAPSNAKLYDEAQGIIPGSSPLSGLARFEQASGQRSRVLAAILAPMES